MGRYRVSLAASAEKELRRLPPGMIARVMPRLERLAGDPRPAGCKKLHGGDHEWRVRVGDYRIVYEIDDKAKIVDVTRIAHRRNVYE
jgi:mRNA interferase RelE/StbE